METLTVIILFIVLVTVSFLVLIGFLIYYWIKRANEKSKASGKSAKGASNNVDYKHICPTCGTKLQFIGVSQMAFCPICNKHVKDEKSSDTKEKIYYVQSKPVNDDYFMEETDDDKRGSTLSHRTFEERPHEGFYPLEQQVQGELQFVPAQPLPPPPTMNDEMDSEPMSILKNRLARGEITPEDFRKLRLLLEK